MSKGNAKARGKRYFELATEGKVRTTFHRRVKLAAMEKQKRLRSERKKLNLLKFKREEDREV
jgi:hypothetical protein